jgi:hypothetical protein
MRSLSVLALFVACLSPQRTAALPSAASVAPKPTLLYDFSSHSTRTEQSLDASPMPSPLASAGPYVHWQLEIAGDIGSFNVDEFKTVFADMLKVSKSVLSVEVAGGSVKLDIKIAVDSADEGKKMVTAVHTLLNSGKLTAAGITIEDNRSPVLVTGEVEVGSGMGSGESGKSAPSPPDAPMHYGDGKNRFGWYVGIGACVEPPHSAYRKCYFREKTGGPRSLDECYALASFFSAMAVESSDYNVPDTNELEHYCKLYFPWDETCEQHGLALAWRGFYDTGCAECQGIRSSPHGFEGKVDFIQEGGIVHDTGEQNHTNWMCSWAPTPPPPPPHPPRHSPPPPPPPPPPCLDGEFDVGDEQNRFGWYVGKGACVAPEGSAYRKCMYRAKLGGPSTLDECYDLANSFGALAVESSNAEYTNDTTVRERYCKLYYPWNTTCADYDLERPDAGYYFTGCARCKEKRCSGSGFKGKKDWIDAGGILPPPPPPIPWADEPEWFKIMHEMHHKDWVCAWPPKA